MPNKSDLMRSSSYYVWARTSRQRMECAQLAAAIGLLQGKRLSQNFYCPRSFESGSKLRAVHTLREYRGAKAVNEPQVYLELQPNDFVLHS
jgi:hypothetical protein